MRYFSFILLFVIATVFFFRNKEKNNTPAYDDRAVKVLLKTESQGLAWEDVSFGLPKNIEPNSFLYHNGEFLVGAGQGVLYRTGSPESGHWTRETIKDPLTSLAGDRRGLAILNIFPGASGPYLSIYEKGIYTKVPGKDFWWPVLREGSPDQLPFYDFLETADGRIFVCSSGGLYMSKNKGNTWEHLYKTSTVTEVVHKNGLLLANTPAGLMRSADDGQSWQKVLNASEMVYDIQSKSDGFIAARVLNNTHHTPLTVSDDEGLSWLSPPGDFSLLKNVQQLVQMDNLLFCSHNDGISRSSDGGRTWELVYSLEKKQGPPTRIELQVSGKKLFALLTAGGC